MMQTAGPTGKKKKQKVKAGKILKSKTIAKVVRNTRKKGKKQVNPDVAVLLKPSENDVLKLLAAQTHVGKKNAHVNMKRYLWKRRTDGIHVFNLEKTWAKLVLAARIIVTVKDPSEIMVMSQRTFGQRGAIKFAKHTGSTPHTSKWVPGTLTNPQNKAYKEPRLIIVDDPMTTFAALRETSYIGIPVIAFCNSDNNTRFVDCAIPCNNKGRYSVGLMFWFLAREVLRMRGKLARTTDWFEANSDACPDLFFYRDPNEIARAKKEKEERERAAQEQADPTSGFGYDTNIVDNDGIGADTGNYDNLDQSWQVEPPMQGLDDWGDSGGVQTAGGAAAGTGAQQYDMYDNTGVDNTGAATGAQEYQDIVPNQQQQVQQQQDTQQQYYYNNNQSNNNQGQFQDW